MILRNKNLNVTLEDLKSYECIDLQDLVEALENDGMIEDVIYSNDYNVRSRDNVHRKSQPYHDEDDYDYEDYEYRSAFFRVDTEKLVDFLQLFDDSEYHMFDTRLGLTWYIEISSWFFKFAPDGKIVQRDNYKYINID